MPTAVEDASALTIETYLSLPSVGRRTELVRGRLSEDGRAGFWRGVVVGNAMYLLESFCRRESFGRVAVGGGVITGRSPDSVRRADVQVIGYARVPKGSLPHSGYLDTPPEVVAEVLAPDDPPGPMRAKADEYLTAGVGAVLLVDPIAETVRVVRRPGESLEPLRPGDTIRLDDVLPGFEADVAAFFED